MRLRKSTPADVDRIMEILNDGRAAIAKLGIDQWAGGYPQREVIEADVEWGESYVAEDEDGTILGTEMICFFGEPDYSTYDNGEWLTDSPLVAPRNPIPHEPDLSAPDAVTYCVVHRVAVAASAAKRGVGLWMLQQAEELARANGMKSMRIDTHPQNTVMRHMVEKAGYTNCCTIYISHAEGLTPERAAYEKILQPLDLEELSVVSHSCVRIAGSKVVYTDPFEVPTAMNDADVVLVTHSHYDHLSPEDLVRVIGSNTVIAAPETCRQEMEAFCAEQGIPAERQVYVEPSRTYQIGGLQVETKPSFNLNKPFHPEENRWVGYVITLDGRRYYVAGDTDDVPQNHTVACDVACVPVGGTYTVTAQEAAEFVAAINPRAAVPTHYGTAVGKREDGPAFVAALSQVAPNVASYLKMPWE